MGAAVLIRLADSQPQMTSRPDPSRQIFFGVERGSDGVRHRLGRRTPVADIERIVDRCVEQGSIPYRYPSWSASRSRLDRRPEDA